MEPRLRLDVTAADLAYAFRSCSRSLDRAALEATIEAHFGGGDAAGALSTLSARSGLDAALSGLALPPGSEVLCSGLNVPDMARVLERHGLECVPVDIDLATLAPLPESIEEHAGPRTRALLCAHLFGARAPVDELFRTARERGWIVIEDAAQAFVGSRFPGHRDADLTLFSFGPIKTATALGTGVVRVRDQRLFERMRAHVARWPARTNGSFARRVAKFAGLRGLSQPRVYGALVHLLERTGDLEARLGGLVRGFPPQRLFDALRQRPCDAQLALLARRLERFNGDRLERRSRNGERLLQLLASSVECPGSSALDRTHWVQPVLVDDPVGLATKLRRQGFDCARRATLGALASSRAPHRTTLAAERFVDRVVYLPNGPHLAPATVERLAELVRG